MLPIVQLSIAFSALVDGLDLRIALCVSDYKKVTDGIFNFLEVQNSDVFSFDFFMPETIVLTRSSDDCIMSE